VVTAPQTISLNPHTIDQGWKNPRASPKRVTPAADTAAINRATGYLDGIGIAVSHGMRRGSD